MNEANIVQATITKVEQVVESQDKFQKIKEKLLQKQ